jgi:ATP-dependent Clp protease ATP-binding subunit ClpC
LDIDIERCRNEIRAELDPNFAQEGSQGDGGEQGGIEDPSMPFGAGGVPGGPGGPGEERKELKTPALKAFGRDLTEMARSGEMDPVIGRKDEIRRVIQILCRRTKNNPVLIGEAGVGRRPSSRALRRRSRAASCRRFWPTRGSSLWTSP